jgi:hypothetical protein
MRLKSNLWVKAYLRRRTSAGQFAAVMRHGDDEAGAIYIKINRLDGTLALFGPAPGGLDDSGDGDRQWMRMHKADAITEAEAEITLDRARSFDHDLWIIEVEDRTGNHALVGTEFVGSP